LFQALGHIQLSKPTESEVEAAELVIRERDEQTAALAAAAKEDAKKFKSMTTWRQKKGVSHGLWRGSRCCLSRDVT
jgi:hypothetical protein